MNRQLSFTHIREQIDHVLQKYADISQIYISIGGKYNEPETELESYYKIRKTQTNSDMQMIPSFLREKNSHRTLVIIWDIFHTRDDIIINRHILDGIQRKHRHISYMMINNCCTQESLDDFIPYMIETAIRHQIRPSHLMICNYIRFKNNPNTTEQIYEKNIPLTIDRILSQTQYAAYRDCFYQWFGYHAALYSYIYQYSTMMSILSPGPAIEILSELIYKYCMQLSNDMTVIQDRNVIRLLSNIYNIEQYGVNNTGSPTQIDSLLKFLVDSNSIVVK